METLPQLVHTQLLVLKKKRCQKNNPKSDKRQVPRTTWDWAKTQNMFIDGDNAVNLLCASWKMSDVRFGKAVDKTTDDAISSSTMNMTV